MHGEPSQLSDPTPPVRELEAHRSRACRVHLDDEQAEGVGLALRALDVGEDLAPLLRPDRGEERLDVLVRDEPDEEVHVVRRRPPDGDVHAGSSWTRARERSSRSPDASATPPRISTSPASAATVIGSSSNTAP